MYNTLPLLSQTPQSEAVCDADHRDMYQVPGESAYVTPVDPGGAGAQVSPRQSLRLLLRHGRPQVTTGKGGLLLIFNHDI